MKGSNMKKLLFIGSILFLLVGSSFSQNQGYENVLKTDSTTWILYHGELEYYMKDLVYVLKKMTLTIFIFGLAMSFCHMLILSER